MYLNPDIVDLGAAREMTEALIVNPYHVEETADALLRAATMSSPNHHHRSSSAAPCSSPSASALVRVVRRRRGPGEIRCSKPCGNPGLPTIVVIQERNAMSTISVRIDEALVDAARAAAKASPANTASWMWIISRPQS